MPSPASAAHTRTCPVREHFVRSLGTGNRIDRSRAGWRMNSDLGAIIVNTRVAHARATVGDVFEECVACNVSGLPYCDAEGRITGRVSLRHTLKKTCVPDYVVRGAHMLGDAIKAVRIPNEFVRELLDRPVEPFILREYASMPPGAPTIKALAIMEQLNTDYVFVVDGGKYLGIVTRRGIASLMLNIGPN